MIVKWYMTTHYNIENKQHALYSTGAVVVVIVW